MKKQAILLIICLFVSFSATISIAEAQFGKKKRAEKQEKRQQKSREEIEEEGHEIVKELDSLDAAWDEIAEELGTYAGLARYCTEDEYKQEVNELLDKIHHYDTLLYQILISKAEIEGRTKTLSRTIKEIEKVETKYKPKNFALKLKDDCKGRKEIEKDKEKLKLDVQTESYDGKALIIDNDIHTYIKRIAHLLHLVDKHAHHLLD